MYTLYSYYVHTGQTCCMTHGNQITSINKKVYKRVENMREETVKGVYKSHITASNRH